MDEETLVPISMPDQVGDETAMLSRGILSDSVSIECFRRPEDDAIVAKVQFGSKTESPARCAHGGSIAAVLDECMGAACWVNGYNAMGARLDVRFRRPAIFGKEFRLTARLASVRGRTINVKARMKDVETGRSYADANGVYVQVNPPKSGTAGRPCGQEDPLPSGHKRK